MAKFRRTRWVWGAGVLGMLVVGTVLLSQLTRPTAQALASVYESPNRNDMVNKDTGAPDDDIRHILKRENSSTTDNLEMTVYFSTPDPNEVIRLTDRGPGLLCSLTGSSSEHVWVTLSDRVSAPITYRIARSRICPPATTSATNVRTDLNGAYFFGSYQVPSSFTPANHPTPDADTGLYPLDIRIRFNPDTSEVPVGETNNPSDGQVVTFKVGVNSCGAVPGCTKYISTRPVPSGERNYSTLGLPPSARFSTQYFKFGLPCTATVKDRLTVNVYDVDNHADWGGISPANGRFWIERRVSGNTWAKIDLNGPINEFNAVVTGGDFRNGGLEVRPDEGSGRTSTVTFDLQPHTNYRLGVDNIYSSNLLGVGLPTETIFGDINCSVTLDGRIDATPADNPIEVGETVSLQPIATRGGGSFTSQYSYTWRTWYDNGDGIWLSPEEQPCAYVGNGQVNNHTGTGDRALGGACNILAKTTGNVSQICGQLVITVNPAVDPYTKVGAGAPPDGVKRCIKVGKYPHLEVRNGDVWAGGRFEIESPTCAVVERPVISSSQRQLSGGFYTSYATYGVTSLGLMNKFGSQGLPYDTGANTPANDLVFANTANGSNVDGYFHSVDSDNSTFRTDGSIKRCLNDPFDLFGSRALASPNVVTGTQVNISDLTGDTLLTSAASIRLRATDEIPAGRKMVIYAPNADINIVSNIVYDKDNNNLYSSIDQIPQVVILSAKSIIVHWDAIGGLNVGGKVTQIDGIYAAKTNFYTCDRLPASLHLCETQLKVNGAIIAGKHVIPLRTSGAEAGDLSGMAEIFNLRSDSLINQLPEAGNPTVFIKTMSEKEVPPRF